MVQPSSGVDSQITEGRVMEKEEINPKNANSTTYLDQIEHFDHEHPLSFIGVIEQKENFHCKACRLRISGEVYACISCGYYLHKACSELSNEVLHPLHPQHSLKLLSDHYVHYELSCAGCKSPSRTGFAYVCFPCGFLLHAECFSSTNLSALNYEDQRQKAMERVSASRFKSCLFKKKHKVDLVICDSSFYVDCSFCAKEIKGVSFRCFDCCYDFHQECLGFPWDMQFPFHPQHPFYTSLHKHSNLRCLVCKCVLFSVDYSCSQCDLHLHLYCAKALERVIKFKSHKHNLYYVGPNAKIDVGSRCMICSRRIGSPPFWFCMDCPTYFHFDCAQIPSSIKSKYHIHQITLGSFFDEENSTDYYCDICEEERIPKDHIYYCTECPGSIVAHLDCALNSDEVWGHLGKSSQALEDADDLQEEDSVRSSKVAMKTFGNIPTHRGGIGGRGPFHGAPGSSYGRSYGHIGRDRANRTT